MGPDGMEERQAYWDERFDEALEWCQIEQQLGDEYEPDDDLHAVLFEIASIPRDL